VSYCEKKPNLINWYWGWEKSIP